MSIKTISLLCKESDQMFLYEFSESRIVIDNR